MKQLWWFVENTVIGSFMHKKLLCTYHWHWAEGDNTEVRVRDKDENNIVPWPGTHSLDHFWYL